MSEALDEQARQRALDTYHIVDSLPEAAYDDVVRLAAAICEVPIALVSLIDRDRQWFKARVGLASTSTARDHAFCDHAIRRPEQLMEVGDAALDPRFVANPLVTGEPHIRFYAGMPLVTPGGAAVGTVCVIDEVPRTLDARQRDALAALARLTMNLLEGRHRERALERATLLDVVPETAPDAAPVVVMPGCCVVIVELQGADVVAQRIGERAFERLLHELVDALDGCVDHRRGDSVSRVSGSAEAIVVLHGDAPEATLQAIGSLLPTFERRHAVTLLSAAARAEPAHEAPTQVYLRADAALSTLKDERVAPHAASHAATL